MHTDIQPPRVLQAAPTEEGDADFAEGVELELVGGLQQRLGVGRVDDQRPRVDELQQQLQHVGADVAHAQLQHLPVARLPRRPDRPIMAERGGEVRGILGRMKEQIKNKTGGGEGGTRMLHNNTYTTHTWSSTRVGEKIITR